MNNDTHVEIARGMRLQWESAQSAHVLLYPEGMVRLNQSAAEILRRCDGRSVTAIVADLEDAFEQSGLEADVVEFLEDASNKGWVNTLETTND